LLIFVPYFGYANQNQTIGEIMKTTVHSAETRGHADHGWLNAKHSFSFANYYDPERVNFGMLRVLNDDIVAAGMGFGQHPHDNMEIITIPLEGAIAHKDSMGNTATVNAGEIQVMSAGTGVTHSEFNPSETEALNLLQIWVIPNKRNVEPRYDQQVLDLVPMKNAWSQILSPNQDDAGVWVHQNAWFHMGEFEAGTESYYNLKDDPKNGLYIFVIEGQVEVAGQTLSKRDGMGIWETKADDLINFTFLDKSKVLLMEVPMQG